MKPRLFLSYAREDVDRVTQLYDDLMDAGYHPWMDTKDIVAGERWEHSIWKAVRNADFVLACLSTRSVGKRGFLQKELKRVLSIWEEKLEDDIYLIPIRLDECIVPENLADFQWLNLFERDGWTGLLSALRAGVERSGKLYEFQGSTGRKITSRRVYEYKDKESKYEIDIQYPVIEGAADPGVREINTRLEGFIIELIHGFRATYVTGDHETDWSSQFTSVLAAAFTVTLLTDELLSLKIDFSQYGAGAAHSQEWSRCFNYQFKPTVPVELYRLFRPDTQPEHLKIISTLCIDNLKSQAQKDEIELESLWLDDGASPKADNFEVFNLTERSIIFTFDPYQVGFYAWHTRKVEIPYDSIREFLDPSGVLKPYL